MEEIQDISRHSQDMPVKPLWPEGDNQTTYIPIDFFPYKYFVPGWTRTRTEDWLCSGLTSQSTIFQSCRDGAIASWVINQYFRGVKCLAQGHNTAAVGFEPRTSRSGVRHSTTEPPRSPRTEEICSSVVKYSASTE